MDQILKMFPHLSAIGLIGLAAYQFSTGDIPHALQNLMLALTSLHIGVHLPGSSSPTPGS